MKKLLLPGFLIIASNCHAMDVTPIPTEVVSGQSVSGWVYDDEYKLFEIKTLDSTVLTVTLDDLTADVDLYVINDYFSSEENYDCRPYLSGNMNERCDVSVNENSRSFVLIHGYDASNYKLTFNLSTN